MPKNREPVFDPEESIGTEDEEEEEEEESSGEEGSDDENPLTKARSQLSPPQKIQPQPSSSSEDEEDGDDNAESDTDSDGAHPKSNSNLKPVVSKPVVTDPPKPASAASTRRARTQTGSTGPTSPTKSGVKRPAEKENDAKNAKKSKKKSDTAAEVGDVSEKKPQTQLFQRLWSEEDEIVILKGMMEYATKKKADPVADIGAFLEFIKKSLHIDVTKTQLQDKMRRLRKKYENNASKEKNGKDRIFSKPHEQAAYDLSKKIWGSVGENNGTVGSEKVPETPKALTSSVVRKSRSKNAVAMTPNKLNDVEDKEMKDVEAEDAVEGLKKNMNVVGGGRLGWDSGFSLAEWILNEGAMMVEDAKREEMEVKWRKMKEQEVEVFLKRSELMCEQARLVLEALRKAEQ